MQKNLIRILEQEKESLLHKLSLIEQTIRAYKISDVEIVAAESNSLLLKNETYLHKSKMTIDKYFAYDIHQPIRKKILCIIKNENRFLHVREIVRIAHQLEQEIPVATFFKKISPALCFLKNLPNSCIVSVVVAKSHFNTFWGSKQWLDVNGNIKDEFMYNESQLAGFNKKDYNI